MVLKFPDAVQRVLHALHDGTGLAGRSMRGAGTFTSPEKNGLSMGGFRYRSSPGPCYSSSNSGRRQWKKLSTRRARAATVRAEVTGFSIAVNAMERAGYPR